MPKPDFEQFPNCAYPIVRVVWVDSLFLPQGWRSVESTLAYARGNSRIPHDTVGYLLDLNPKGGYVLIASNTRRDGAASNAISIPLASVVEIVDLEGNKKLWPK